MSDQGNEPNAAVTETKPSTELSSQVSGTAAEGGEANASGVAVDADASITGFEKNNENDMDMSKSPAADRDKLDLEFRMCDVYSAPRLPHTLASSWNPILKSAEDLKFGRFRGQECPGRSKQPNAGKKPDTPPMSELPKRPRVPLAPRRHAPKQQASSESEEQGKSAAELDCSGNSSASQNSHAPKRPKSPLSARSPQQLDRSEGRKAKPELQLCEWCGAMEPPDHPKHCKLRVVECRHCKQKLALVALRQHLKTCMERPIAQHELQNKKFSTSNNANRAGSRSATPTESENSKICLQSLTSLKAMWQEMQQRVDAATKKAMLHEVGTISTNSGKTEVDNLEAALHIMAHKLAVVELSASSGARVQPGASPPNLLQPVQPSPSQDLLPPTEKPANIVEALQDLQRRLRIFQMLLSSACETAGVKGLQKPVPASVQRAPPQGSSKLPPPIADSIASWQTADTPRSNRAGKQLPPLNSARGRVAEDDGRSRPREQSRERSTSRASSRRGRSNSRQEEEAEEMPPLLIGPGPAAVGYRDMPIDQMRREVEQERQRYIAQGIKALARQQPRASLMRADNASPAPGGAQRPSSISPAPGTPTVSYLKKQLEQERTKFISQGISKS